MKRVIRRTASLRQSPRRGSTLIIAFVALLIVSMLGASLIRTVTLSRQQLQRETLRTQAVLLADSGAARAIARMKASPDYIGETWSVPTEQLAAGRTASVLIIVAPDTAHPEQTLIAATAEYPQGSPTPIRVTKRMTITTQQSSAK